MNIGEKIRELRTTQNISMNRLSKICQVSQANLSRIENGQQQPAVDTLERIITALGFTFVDFFSIDNIETGQELKQLMNIIQTLKPKQKQALQIFLEEMKK